MHAWLEHGPNVIDRLIAERPEVFLLAMLKIAQVHRVEVGLLRLRPPVQQGGGFATLGAKCGAKGPENAGRFLSQSREARAVRRAVIHPPMNASSDQQRLGCPLGPLGARLTLRASAVRFCTFQFSGNKGR